MDLMTATPTELLVLEDSSQVGHARRTAQRFAEGLGFGATDAGRAALVATELASNVLKHAQRGNLHLRRVQGRGVAGVELVAVDRGPGFDVAYCAADGYSTGGTQGIGLGAVARQADVFDAHADARGAVVLARVYPRGTKATADYRIGACQHPIVGESACGDTWRVAVEDGRVSALVIDGLGHGEMAEHAATAGGESFATDPFLAPADLMQRMHQGMAGSRGGAAAVAQYDGRGTLRFVGIGNIAASLTSVETSRGLASHPGIVGGQYRKAQVFDFPGAAGQLLVMHSDGLQSRWRLGDYAGLWQRHPAVIAMLLHRDFCRQRDDVTVLAIALGSGHG